MDSAVTDITVIALDQKEVVRADGTALGSIEISLAREAVGLEVAPTPVSIFDHRSPVTGLSFSILDSQIFLGATYEDGTFNLYESQAGQWKRKVKSKDGAVSLVFSESGQRLAITYRDGHVKVFALPDMDPVGSDVQVKVQGEAFVSFVTEESFAVLSSDGKIRLFAQGEDGEFKQQPKVIDAVPGSKLHRPVAIAATSEKIAVAYHDGVAKEYVLRVIDIKTNDRQEIWDRSSDGRVVALLWRNQWNELVFHRATVHHTESVTYIQRPDGIWVHSKRPNCGVLKYDLDAQAFE